jgi:two-component system LytT family response regulator
MTSGRIETGSIQVLIVEDEPPARRRLRALLEAHGDVSIIGEAVHGGEAVQLIESHEPDLVLLDVQLPVATGFEVIDAVGVERMPAVIFLTAYDHYAIKAFEVNAVDYLMKPVEAERLSAALMRVRTRLQEQNGTGAQLGRAMAEIQDRAPLKRIPVRQGGKILFVDVSDIDYVEADGNYIRVWARGANYLLRETLSAYEQKLTPHGFLRIHRGTLVQSNRILELQPLFHGEYSVRLKDGTKLVSGRTYRDQLRVALGLRDEL